jgi:hypothetical protein
MDREKPCVQRMIRNVRCGVPTASVGRRQLRKRFWACFIQARFHTSVIRVILPVTYGLPLETDIVRACRHVSTVPQAGSCAAAKPASFDHSGDGRVPWRYPDALAPKHTREASDRSGNPFRQVRMFRDVLLNAKLLNSKAESDDVGLELSWLGCPVRSSGLFGLLRFSKKLPLIHQTEARLIRRYSGYLGRGRTHDARAH